MARYIDADLLLTDEKTHTLPVGCGRSSGNVVVFVDDIEKLHSADVVQIVRCKDCAVPHNRWTGCPRLNGLVTPPDFYCSYGERIRER